MGVRDKGREKRRVGVVMSNFYRGLHCADYNMTGIKYY